jgi:hypothetical protein
MLYIMPKNHLKIVRAEPNHPTFSGYATTWKKNILLNINEYFLVKMKVYQKILLSRVMVV